MVPLIKALLVDDEQPNLDNLQALLEKYCPEITICGTACDAETARALVYDHRPDLLFLDIQMPGQSGFDLLAGMQDHDFEVIFVTAYDQYAIRAMRFSAIDYLLKPVDIAELQAAVARTVAQRRLKAGNQQLEHLLQFLQTGNRNDQRIALATSRETRYVRTDEIIRCESSNNYTSFHLVDGDHLLVCKPIYEYEELLKPHGFLRCHQSHLVNRAFVKSWKKEFGDFLLLTDGTEIPVSRGKKDDVRAALQR